jgi:superfamily II DNA or RNA helicase
MLMKREVNLYPIQEKIINACRDEFRKHKRFVLKAPTGVGKTIIATWIIKQAMNRGKRILFVCDRISLINQTSSVFVEYGIQHGVFQAQHVDYNPGLQVQIGSIQTLARRRQREYDMIIIDECHTWYSAHKKLLEYNPDAYILGLSATPFTKGLGKYFESFIEPLSVRDAIDNGYLCDFEIYGPETIDLSGVRVVAGDYKEDDLALAADKPELVADVVKTWLNLARGLKTIVFSVNVAHGRHLEKEFRKSGINAREINGYMPKEGEDGANKIIQDFKIGRAHV